MGDFQFYFCVIISASLQVKLRPWVNFKFDCISSKRYSGRSRLHLLYRRPTGYSKRHYQFFYLVKLVAICNTKKWLLRSPRKCPTSHDNWQSKRNKRARSSSDLESSYHTPVTGVRQFTMAKLNFAADDYSTLIDWQTSAITEPPLTTELSQIFLMDLVANHNVPVMNFPKFPCHTQSVERCVKLVT